MKRIICCTAIAICVAALGLNAADSAKAPALTMVIMDPLALPLSCPCVKGYAQRDYDQLARYMEQKFGRPVEIHYSESLTAALKKKTNGKADIVIGKRSVVVFDAKKADMKFAPIASLTGKDGKTTQTGLIVVLKDDPAKTLADLKEYKILYGDVEAEEKHGAIMKMLKGHQFIIPEKPETCAACDERRDQVDRARPEEQDGRRHFELCQTIARRVRDCAQGALRVIAETEPIPFVVAFTNDGLPNDVKESVKKCLMSVKDNVAPMTAIESKNGFVTFEEPKKK